MISSRGIEKAPPLSRSVPGSPPPATTGENDKRRAPVDGKIPFVDTAGWHESVCRHGASGGGDGSMHGVNGGRGRRPRTGGDTVRKCTTHRSRVGDTPGDRSRRKGLRKTRDNTTVHADVIQAERPLHRTGISDARGVLRSRDTGLGDLSQLKLELPVGSFSSVLVRLSGKHFVANFECASTRATWSISRRRRLSSRAASCEHSRLPRAKAAAAGGNGWV